MALKTYLKTLMDKPVLVFGLGKTGSSLLKALKKAGVQIVIGDDNHEALEEMAKGNYEVLTDYDQDFSRFGMVLLSPGVPLTHPEPHRLVQSAQKAGVEVIGDLELFFRSVGPCKTIGVTGTNGKSTTVSLLHHIFKTAGKAVELAGNIGRPVFDIPSVTSETIIILEMSSFQIDLCPKFRPDISVVLNVTPDHLDRHGSMEQYASVKERMMEGAGSAVIVTDDEFTRAMHMRAVAAGLREVVEVSTLRALEKGIYVLDGVLYDGEAVGNLESIVPLKGIHNHQNAAAAYAAAKACGLSGAEIFAAMQSFPGLQHRQFLVRTINGVSYVNDSKATNAAAAAVALGCRSNVYWIVGGRKKKNGLEGLEEFFPRIKHAFLIGEATEDFGYWFDRYGMAYTKCFTLEHAVAKAHEMAQDHRGQPGGAGVVLLSPACASFDQFKSFEDRGENFLALVAGLKEGS